MDYIINGGKRLRGEIEAYGAKNCALALLGATILTDDEIVLNNCPRITDVENMLKLLASLGKTVIRKKDTVSVKGSLTTTVADRTLASLLRGSALILGSCIAKYHAVTLPLPGGCAIGERPMDIHLKGVEAFGVDVRISDGVVECKGIPKEGFYEMRLASVGATENLLCCCAMTEGVSVLVNCACEPEVVSLERMLKAMGADIDGIGTPRLTIRGAKKLHGAKVDVIPDRIVTATYLSAAVSAGGEITVTRCCPDHLDSFLRILQARFDVKRYDNAVKITVNRQPAGYGNIVTGPYPSFPTDMQPLVMSLSTFSDGGRTVIQEKLFENRLRHQAEELSKMGADIKIDGDTAEIVGASLYAAEVQAWDLRGGAALVVAALHVGGTSAVINIEHIERGYVDLAGNLKSLGADIFVRS